MCLALNIFRPFNSHWATKLSTHRKFKAIYNLLKWILRVQHCSKGFWHILFLTRVSRQSFSISLARLFTRFCSIGSASNRFGSSSCRNGTERERDWHVRVRTCMLACVCCSVVIIVVSGRLDGTENENENENEMLMLLCCNVRFLFLFAYYWFVSHEAFDVRLRH